MSPKINLQSSTANQPEKVNAVVDTYAKLPKVSPDSKSYHHQSLEVAKKIHSASSDSPVRKEEIFKILRNKNSEEIKEISKSMNVAFKVTLEKHLQGAFDSKEQPRVANLLKGIEQSFKTEISFRLTELQNVSIQYAEKRGELLGSRSVNQAKLRELDQSYNITIKKFDDLKSNEVVQGKLSEIIQNSEDLSRLHVVSKNISKMELARGYTRAQGQSHSALAGNRYIERQADLLNRNPEMAKKIEQLRSNSYRSGSQRWQQGVAASEDLYNAMWGLGTDEAKIFRTLEGKSPEQISAIKTAYHRYYGVSLSKRLKADLGGNHLERANQLMKGDKIAGQSVKLFHAMNGLGTNEQEIYEVFAQAKDLNEIAAIETHFNKNYAKKHGVKNLNEALEQDLSGDELRRAHAEKSKDSISVAATKLHDAVEGLGTDEKSIYTALSEMKFEEIESLREQYIETYGTTLDSDLKADLSGLELSRAQRLLEGDSVGADAAGLEHAMNGGVFGLGTDEDAIREILTETSDFYRSKLKQRYETDYGAARNKTLETELASELGTHDLQMTRSLLIDGKLSDAELLRDAVVGIGTNEDQLHGALKDKSLEQIDAMRREYLEKFGVELDSDILFDVSGDDHFDVKMALLGSPTSTTEDLNRLELRHAYERNGAWSSLIDVFSSQGEVTDVKMEETRELLSSVALVEKVGGQLSQELQIDVDVRIEIQKKAEESMREAKNSVADSVATTGTIIVATGTTIGTLGAGAPLWAAALATAASSAYTRTLIKAGIKGQGYGWEEASMDVGRSSVEGASVFVGGFAGKKAAEFVLRQAAIRTLTKLGTEISDEAIKLTTSRLMSRFSTRLGAGAVESLADGVVSGAFESAIGPDSLSNFENESLEMSFRRWVTNLAVGTGAGGFTGASLGTGFTAGGEGLGRIFRGVDEAVIPVANLTENSVSTSELRTSVAAENTIEVNDPILDTILNSPSIEGERNASLPNFEDGSYVTNDLNGFDNPEFSLGEEALVGAGVGDSSPELSAAFNGNPYDADSSRGQEFGNLKASIDENNAGGGNHNDLTDNSFEQSHINLNKPEPAVLKTKLEVDPKTRTEKTSTEVKDSFNSHISKTTITGASSRQALANELNQFKLFKELEEAAKFDPSVTELIDNNPVDFAKIKKGHDKIQKQLDKVSVNTAYTKGGNYRVSTANASNLHAALQKINMLHLLEPEQLNGLVVARIADDFIYEGSKKLTRGSTQKEASDELRDYLLQLSDFGLDIGRMKGTLQTDQVEGIVYLEDLYGTLYDRYEAGLSDIIPLELGSYTDASKKLLTEMRSGNLRDIAISQSDAAHYFPSALLEVAEADLAKVVNMVFHNQLGDHQVVFRGGSLEEAEGWLSVGPSGNARVTSNDSNYTQRTEFPPVFDFSSVNKAGDFKEAQDIAQKYSRGKELSETLEDSIDFEPDKVVGGIIIFSEEFSPYTPTHHRNDPQWKDSAYRHTVEMPPGTRHPRAIVPVTPTGELKEGAFTMVVTPEILDLPPETKSALFDAFKAQDKDLYQEILDSVKK